MSEPIVDRLTKFTPDATGLGRDANVFLRFLAKYVLGLLAPFIKYWSTPERAASQRF